jgi:hypothetical protein
MHRLKVFFVALMGVVVLSGFVSAMASAALPVILNAKSEVAKAVTFSGATVSTTTLAILKGSLNVKCGETKSQGEFEAGKPLGPFHIHFTKCTTNLGGTCTGLGDETGSILVLGIAHIVYDTLTPALGAAVLFLIEPTVHFSCVVAGITKLILVKGENLCLITPLKLLATEFTVKCEASTTTAGDPLEVVYWNEAGTEVNIKEGLLSSENDGTSFEMSSEAGSGSFTTAEQVEIMA